MIKQLFKYEQKIKNDLKLNDDLDFINVLIGIKVKNNYKPEHIHLYPLVLTKNMTLKNEFEFEAGDYIESEVLKNTNLYGFNFEFNYSNQTFFINKLNGYYSKEVKNEEGKVSFYRAEQEIIELELYITIF